MTSAYHSLKDDAICPSAANSNGYHWFASATDKSCGNCGQSLHKLKWGVQPVINLNSLQLSNALNMCSINAKAYPLEERLQWHRWCSVFKQAEPFIALRERAEREAKPNRGLYFPEGIKQGQAVWVDAAGNYSSRPLKIGERATKETLKVGDGVALDDKGQAIPFSDRHTQTFVGTVVAFKPAPYRTVTIRQEHGRHVTIVVAPYVVLEHTPAAPVKRLTVGDRVTRIDSEFFNHGVIVPYDVHMDARPFGKITQVTPGTGYATLEVLDRSYGYSWAHLHVGPGVELVSEVDAAKDAATKVSLRIGSHMSEAQAKALGALDKGNSFIFGNVDYSALEIRAFAQYGVIEPWDKPKDTSPEAEAERKRLLAKAIESTSPGPEVKYVLDRALIVHDEVTNLTPESVKRSVERVKNFMSKYGVPDFTSELTLQGDAAAERWRDRNRVGPCKFKGCELITYRSHLCTKHLEELVKLESGAGISPKYRYVTKGVGHKNVIVTVDVGSDWED